MLDATVTHTAPHVGLDVFADIACPWCFIAHRRLGRALDAAATLRLESSPRFRWRAYQLEPRLPARGVDAIAFANRKFGGRAARETAWAELSDVGASEGIRFAFRRQRRFPNTLLAHRIIALAPTEADCDFASPSRVATVDGSHGDLRDAPIRSDQRSVAGALFSALFEEGVDVGDLDATLEFLAASCVALDPERVRRALVAGCGTDRVREDLGIGAAIGIDEVPVVMANLRHAVWGAQPEIVFRRLLVVADHDGNEDGAHAGHEADAGHDADAGHEAEPETDAEREADADPAARLEPLVEAVATSRAAWRDDRLATGT